MTEYYMSTRLIDGKPKKIIADKNGDIVNRNPSKDELKDLEKELYTGKHKIRKHIYYNETNTCDNIKEDGKKCEEKLVPHTNAFRERDKEGKETGRWLCNKCSCKQRSKLPNSNNNIMKSLRNTRINTLDPNSSKAIGDLFQELTCIWRSTISIVPIEDLNKKLDNYNTPIDHSWDSELGIIQTKGRIINTNNRWVFDTRTEYYKKFDHTICYCTDRNMKIIERMYIFPKDVMYNTSIGIVKYDCLGRLYKNGW